ncbi:GNAT family N-acetyltransferase [Sporosarcina ureilytica]|uniref:GNAT family N-acetyltransferase n=1 Tax=Sporosarcina ureilytica TaxID=298596 RepID=A0A1D8JKF3_9BACL|nr:GNAT family N-acetyltransferase [Sporosarcina ureilytica]AOV09198.1 GNAT family N-acetyltransferase [Sporosarcina ureilytica]
MIETERLVIRPYEIKDYKEWARGYRERLPSTYKYDEGNDGEFYSEKWFADWVKGFQKDAEKDDTYLFGVFRKEDGAHIGEIELVTILRLDYEWGMMGYAIHNQFHRQGYGKESVIAATELFFEDLKFYRIELQIHVDNEPSKKLAESTGFEFECLRKKHYYEGGKWTDQLIYVKTRPSLMG